MARLVRPFLMARRTSRSDVPTDVPAVLRGLAACRSLMLDVQRQVKPTGACFYGASMVLAALDGFAAFLTGQRYYLAALENRGFGAPEPVDPDAVYDRPRLPPASRAGASGDDPWEP